MERKSIKINDSNFIQNLNWQEGDTIRWKMVHSDHGLPDSVLLYVDQPQLVGNSPQVEQLTFPI